MRSTAKVVIANNAGATTSPVTVERGGLYRLGVKATGYGTVDVQALLPDGATYANIASQFTADGFAAPVYLPAGAQVKAVIATATAVYAVLERVLV